MYQQKFPSQHYSKTPLTEAILQIKIISIPDLSLDDLSNAFTDIAQDYPQKEDLHQGEFQLSTQGQINITGTQSQTGYQYISSDGKQILQVTLNDFTFTRLAPYDRWESFRSEAQRLWTIYRKVTEPVTISRAAVRYISRLELPLPFDDFRKYLRTAPEISSDLPQELDTYFMQLQFRISELLCSVIVNQAFLPITDPEPKAATVVFDIDVHRLNDLSKEENELWNFFEQLRVLKNDVFEASITDEMRGVIK